MCQESRRPERSALGELRLFSLSRDLPLTLCSLTFKTQTRKMAVGFLTRISHVALGSFAASFAHLRKADPTLDEVGLPGPPPSLLLGLEQSLERTERRYSRQAIVCLLTGCPEQLRTPSIRTG